MNKYIIKAAKHGKDDRFGFKEATEHLYFFAAGLKDLQNLVSDSTWISCKNRTIFLPHSSSRRCKIDKSSVENYDVRNKTDQTPTCY